MLRLGTHIIARTVVHHENLIAVPRTHVADGTTVCLESAVLGHKLAARSLAFTSTTQTYTSDVT